MRSTTETNAVCLSDGQAGFSLVELLISISLVIIILGFIAVLMSGIQKQFVSGRQRAGAVDNAQMAMDTMIRVVRMAGSKANGCPVGFTVVPLTPSVSAGGGTYSKLRVQADWNAADCNITGTDENVTYSVSGGVLYLDPAQTVPFVDGIGAIRFKFYDSSNTLIADPVTNASQISLVQIAIDTVSTDGYSSTITSRVKPRLSN